MEIDFKAIINKVSTATGGGFRITLDLPETEAINAAKLMALREMVLNIKAKPETE